MEEHSLKVEAKDQGIRIDKFLASEYQDLSRSFIQTLIENKKITVNENTVDKSYKITKNDFIKIIIEEKESEIKAVEMALDIVYEDQDIIVINKEADRVVHPAPGHHNDTIVNALLAHVDNLSAINGVKRPGIVHRLDKDTSGLLIAAKNDKSHKSLAQQFKSRSVEKYYYALIEGNLAYEKGKIDAPIGRDPNNRKKMAVRKRRSKRAVSRFKIIEEFKNHTLIQVKIETGRTHQIRVHFSYLGHPVVGDQKYGAKNDLNAQRQLLHAKKLIIKHPATGEKMKFEAELKEDFKGILAKLREQKI
ncbi:MAG: 23S rRNA pseudouridine synthase [Halanaerobium sp. 4-GBenrich]|jgi:23S rRNA pseudouridine1911/1915/1917 synthase|uniref:Pseudouridine synthase n=1 Tax=Halanaerobium congolense TaxID=54121 RepID=A0A1G6HN94_9FIRM|nr:RluA family pseudouridine synthase [Halanaerobium congolense]ODS49716.1 MAG: 23S rRNA pseudouridine synthase [Halanaerobium sp. 4-GBenrich]PXV69964.1 RluA family pseudouridine synthase [Halanaerobium congolense]TDS33078.1 23S rRNA pseudouridine1911/1915/1917 synthase [Halanaerobium congolense]TDX48172.1 RluA family pseudouridine synthase [Halanaerobium congolense]SDB95674.1 ribosomal large subunit pseudouridine synthase D [Halanaerobium congolense]